MCREGVANLRVLPQVVVDDVVVEHRDTLIEKIGSIDPDIAGQRLYQRELIVDGSTRCPRAVGCQRQIAEGEQGGTGKIRETIEIQQARVTGGKQRGLVNDAVGADCESVAGAEQPAVAELSGRDFQFAAGKDLGIVVDPLRGDRQATLRSVEVGQ